MATDESRQNPRILVVGAQFLDADLCVNWNDPVPNVADFDVVIVLVPNAATARTVDRDTFYEYRKRIVQLLETEGELYVIAVPRESWELEGQSRISGSVDNYEWCPIWVTIEEESGTTISDKGLGFGWYFERVQRWDIVIAHPRAEGESTRSLGGRAHAILYDWEPLAINRAKQALGTRMRFALHEIGTDQRTLRTFLKPDPSLTSGWVHFIGLAPPWTSESAADTLLTKRFDRSGSTALPQWVIPEMMPPTKDLDRQIEVIENQLSHLRSELTQIEETRSRAREAVGLVYESGKRLEDLVGDALSELGAALGEAVAQEEYTALYEGVVAAVEIKGNSKSASQDDLRALADYLTQHDLTADYAGSRGILVVNAWRNLPLTDRAEWFPDNVRRAAKAAGRISLVRAADLYRALLAYRAGEAAAAAYLTRVFTQSGVIDF